MLKGSDHKGVGAGGQDREGEEAQQGLWMSCGWLLQPDPKGELRSIKLHLRVIHTHSCQHSMQGRWVFIFLK